jgi:hypothetical protein
MHHLVFLILKLLYKLLVYLTKQAGAGAQKLQAARAAQQRAEQPGPRALPRTVLPAGAAARPATSVDPVRQRLVAELPRLASRAEALVTRCRREPACALLLPTLDGFVVPGVDELRNTLEQARDPAALLPIFVGAARIANLLTLLDALVEQRGSDELVELIDDADALAESCYRPIVEFCQARDLPLSSDRVAALFGGDCSPALVRVGDPTGMAILQLPWSWLAEVHRWPAVGHEVGHDFYLSVDGLDDELLARLGLTAVRDGGPMPMSANGFHRGHVDTIIAAWRHELVADAFGVMMLGPAYAITTLEIFANPDQPEKTLMIDRDGDGYEAHPPGHVRALFVCRLLQRMGYGVIGDTLEQQWRARHGNPDRLYLPIPDGWLHLIGDGIIERALAIGVSLYEDRFAALEQIPLRSIPGFDFGPREQQAAERVKQALLAGRRANVRDARLLIAGAVLAWSEQRGQAAAILRAARLAVGKLDLPVRGPKVTAAVSADEGFTAELVRESIMLDAVLAPPRGSLLRR